MSYTFNKKLVEQLRKGEICAYFNREKDSLEMLQALCKEVWPKDDTQIVFNLKYYWTNLYTKPLTWNASNSIWHPDVTSIPLSNFVQPEQSERDVMAGFDERLKRLETLLDEALAKETPESLKEWLATKPNQPEPKWTPKVGEWFKDMLESLYYCTVSDQNGVEGDNQNGGTISCTLACELTKPTDKEVEDYMVGLTKEKYPVGTIVKACNIPLSKTVIDSHNFHYTDGIGLLLGPALIWQKTQGWAEIVNPVRRRAEWNNEYYYLSDELDTETGIEILDKFDDKRYAVGNYFQTAQQAEEMAVLMQFTLNNPELVKQLIKTTNHESN